MARKDEIQNALNAWPTWPNGTPKNATTFWLLLDAYNGWQQAQQQLDTNQPAPAPVILDDAAALAADQLENTTREKMRDDANFKAAAAKVVPGA